MINALNACLLLPWMRARAPLRSGRPAPLAAVATATATATIATAPHDAPSACGWFDSSHDLQHGLCVQEHLSPDSLVRELPLGPWLDLQLSHWRAQAPAAAAPSFTHAT